MNACRFEVVRTNAGHHARLVAANGEIVWTTEVYTERATAEDAVAFLRGLGVRPLEISALDERDQS